MSRAMTTSIRHVVEAFCPVSPLHLLILSLSVSKRTTMAAGTVTSHEAPLCPSVAILAGPRPHMLNTKHKTEAQNALRFVSCVDTVRLKISAVLQNATLVVEHLLGVSLGYWCAR